MIASSTMLLTAATMTKRITRRWIRHIEVGVLASRLIDLYDNPNRHPSHITSSHLFMPTYLEAHPTRDVAGRPSSSHIRQGISANDGDADDAQHQAFINDLVCLYMKGAEAPLSRRLEEVRLNLISDGSVRRLVDRDSDLSEDDGYHCEDEHRDSAYVA